MGTLTACAFVPAVYPTQLARDEVQSRPELQEQDEFMPSHLPQETKTKANAGVAGDGDSVEELVSKNDSLAQDVGGGYGPVPDKKMRLEPGAAEDDNPRLFYLLRTVEWHGYVSELGLNLGPDAEGCVREEVKEERGPPGRREEEGGRRERGGKGAVARARG